MDKIVNTIIEMIKIPSVSGNLPEIEKVISYIKDFFKDKKVCLKEFRYENADPVLLISNCDTMDFDFLSIGHIDVVPARDEQFVPYIKDEKLYGRGTIDMKTQIVISMYNLLEIVEKNLDLKMGILITSDEETTSNGVKAFIKNEKISSKIIMDPDAGDLYTLVEKYKHSVGIKLVGKGVSGHSSRPWTGDNAINNLMDIIQKLMKIFPQYSKNEQTPKDLWLDTMCVTAFNTKKTVNVIPNFAEANLNFRLTDKISLDDLKKILDDACKDTSCEYEVVMSSNGCYMDINYEPIQRYKKIAEKILGKTLSVGHMNGATDARMFPDSIIKIMHSPITDSETHSIDENIELSSIKNFYEIQKEFINSLIFV